MAYQSTVKNTVRDAVLALVKAVPFHKENVKVAYISGAARVIVLPDSGDADADNDFYDLVIGTSNTKVTGSEVPANTWITSKTADGKAAVLSNNFSGSSTITVNLDAAVSLGDTTITVAALGGAIPAGTKLTFVDTTAKEVITSAAAAAGATTISIYASQYAITDNVNALYHDGTISMYPVVGTGDGSTRAFTATLPFGDTTVKRIQPGTFMMFDADTWATAVEQVTDDGNGNLVGVIRATGAAGGSGTINYTTGAISYTFTTAPTNGTEILAKYYYGKFHTAKISKENSDMFRNPDIVVAYKEAVEDTEYLLTCEIRKQPKELLNGAN